MPRAKVWPVSSPLDQLLPSGRSRRQCRLSQHCSRRSSLPPPPLLCRSPVCGRSSWAAVPQACCSRTACWTPAALSRYSRVGLTREHRATSRAEPTRSASGCVAAPPSALPTRPSGRPLPPPASRRTASRSTSARGSRSACARTSEPLALALSLSPTLNLTQGRPAHARRLQRRAVHPHLPERPLRRAARRDAPTPHAAQGSNPGLADPGQACYSHI